MSQQKNPITENMKLAKIALAAAVAVTLAVTAPVKIKSNRADAMKVFRQGTEKGLTVSVYTDLNKIAENANRLALAAERELGAEDEAVKALKAAAEQISGSDEAEVMLSAYSGIALSADQAYARLTAKGRESAKDAYVNITDLVGVVKRDGYFAKADAFNNDIDSFPASLYASVYGIDRLPTGGK